MMNEYAFVIPAYNPDENLLEVVLSLKEKLDNLIFIIDDGTKEEHQYIFDKLSLLENVIILKHAINMGKGAALKTAFNHILTQYSNIKGVVTLDSDGQHSAKDCFKILSKLEENENNLVLGYRTFSKNIPLKSYLGNNISKFIYKLILGRSFHDTQTGLRGISRNFMKKCLFIKSNRFEFETEQLVIATNLDSINIIEVPIETIYIENNRATTFRPILDSFKIYFVLFRYGLSSVITSIFDFLIFSIALKFGLSLYISNITSRTFAMIVQFLLLKNFVFNTSSGIKSFILFYCYVLLMGSISTWIQIGLIEHIKLNVMLSKIITEIVLFFINFAFLKLFIFRKRKLINETNRLG